MHGWKKDRNIFFQKNPPDLATVAQNFVGEYVYGLKQPDFWTISAIVRSDAKATLIITKRRANPQCNLMGTGISYGWTYSHLEQDQRSHSKVL